jgi:hypothetical protein
METHVKVLAVLHLVLAVAGVLIALAIVLATGAVTGLVGTAADPYDARVAIPFIRLAGTAIAIVFVSLAVPGVVVGLGMLRLRPWARVGGIVLSALCLVHVPFGTALGVYGLWVLFSRDTERLFLASRRDDT